MAADREGRDPRGAHAAADVVISSAPGPYARKAVVNAAIDEAPKPWCRERAMAETPESDVVRITPYRQRC